MIDRIRLRRDTSEDWSFYNPILASGEPGVELDTNRIKVGNGISEWNNLPYLLGNLSGLILRIGSNETIGLQWDVADILNIVGSGDTQVFFNDSNNKITIYSSGTLPPLTNTTIVSGLGYIPQISGSYANSTHTHVIPDISGLQNALDTKQASGFYASGIHFHQLTDVSGLIGVLNSKQPLGSYANANHTHTLSISNGVNNTISFSIEEPLKFISSGNVSIGFNDITNSIIIGSSGGIGASFGNILAKQILFKNNDGDIVGSNQLIFEENNELLKVNNFMASGEITGIIDGGLI